MTAALQGLARVLPKPLFALVVALFGLVFFALHATIHVATITFPWLAAAALVRWPLWLATLPIRTVLPPGLVATIDAVTADPTAVVRVMGSPQAAAAFGFPLAPTLEAAGPLDFAFEGPGGAVLSPPTPTTKPETTVSPQHAWQHRPAPIRLSAGPQLIDARDGDAATSAAADPPSPAAASPQPGTEPTSGRGSSTETPPAVDAAATARADARDAARAALSRPCRHRLGLATLTYKGPCYNNHVATILAHFKPFEKVTYRQEIVQANDGCDIPLDWAFLKDNRHLLPPASLPERRSGPHECVAGLGVIVVVPGLASDSHSAYIQTFVRAALSWHFNVVICNTRGMLPGSPLTRPKMICAAHTDDIRTLVYEQFTHEALARRLNDLADDPTHRVEAVPACLVGFSLGGNLVAKFLGQEGRAVAARSAVVAAASLCSPWDFHEAYRNMTLPVSMLLYQQQLAAGLVRHLQRNKDVLVDPETGKGKGASPFCWDTAMKLKTVHQFDEEVVVPHHGFRDRQHYYDESMCFPDLPHVGIPTLCLATDDDTVCGIPPKLDEWRSLCRRNPNIVHIRTPAGGHLGFLGSPSQERRREANALEDIVCRALAEFVVRQR